MERGSTTESPRRPLQFSLRTLFLFVAAVACVCGLVTTVSPMWSIMIGWFVLLVIGHVLGNWWGSTLGRQPTPSEQCAERPAAEPISFAPASRLRHHVVLGRAMFVSAGLSAVVGCGLGVLFVLDRPESPTWIGLLVGSASAGVIGGLFGFLVSAFLSVGLRALREAMPGRHKSQHEPE